MNINQTKYSPTQLSWALIIFALPIGLTLAMAHILPLVVLAVGIVGLAYGALLYRATLPIWLHGPAILLIIAGFVALAVQGHPLGFLSFNWLGGVFSGSFLGKFLWGPPVGSQEYARQVPGWHLNGVKYTDTQILDHLHSALFGLDSEIRSTITIMNGNTRLDIIKSSEGGFAVYCTTDVRAAKNWSLLLDVAKPSTPIEVRLGPDEARLPANNIVCFGLAIRAADSFITNRGPDPNLIWLTGEEAFSRRAPSLG